MRVVDGGEEGRVGGRLNGEHICGWGFVWSGRSGWWFSLVEDCGDRKTGRLKISISSRDSKVGSLGGMTREEDERSIR